MKSPYAIHHEGLVEKEERVDEIECKVFIKCSDSNLLSTHTELVLRDRLCSKARGRRRLWNLL